MLSYGSCNKVYILHLTVLVMSGKISRVMGIMLKVAYDDITRAYVFSEGGGLNLDFGSFSGNNKKKFAGQRVP